MMIRKLTILTTAFCLIGCASMEKSVLMGAGTVGALGAGIGTAAGNNVGSALIGLGVGAVLGSAFGYMEHTSREEKVKLAKLGGKKPAEDKTPSLTSPEVRRIWVPDRIEGDRFIEGHYSYIIEKNSSWSQ